MIPPSGTSVLIPCVVNLNLYRKWLVLASHDSKRKVIEIDLHCATSIRRDQFSDQISGDMDSPNIDNHFVLYLIIPSSNKTNFDQVQGWFAYFIFCWLFDFRLCYITHKSKVWRKGENRIKHLFSYISRKDSMTTSLIL